MAPGAALLPVPAVGGDGTALQVFQLSEGFSDSTNCSLCIAGIGGQNPFCPCHRATAAWKPPFSPSASGVWAPLHRPSHGTSPGKWSTLQVSAPFGAGVQHQPQQWEMQDPSSFLVWLLWTVVFHTTDGSSCTDSFMETPVVVFRARGYKPEGTMSSSGSGTTNSMAMDTPCHHCGRGWAVTEWAQWEAPAQTASIHHPLPHWRFVTDWV